jgi:hypothetical protein
LHELACKRQHLLKVIFAQRLILEYCLHHAAGQAAVRQLLQLSHTVPWQLMLLLLWGWHQLRAVCCHQGHAALKHADSQVQPSR